MVNESKSKDYRKKHASHNKSESLGSRSIASKSKSNFLDVISPGPVSISSTSVLEQINDVTGDNSKLKESEIEVTDADEDIEYEAGESISKEMLEEIEEEIETLVDDATEDQILQILSEELFEDEDELEEDESSAIHRISFVKRKQRKEIHEMEEYEDEDEMSKELEDIEEDELAEERGELLDLLDIYDEEEEEEREIMEEKDEEQLEEEEDEIKQDEEEQMEEELEEEVTDLEESDLEIKISSGFISVDSKVSLEEQEVVEEKELEIEEEEELEAQRISSIEIDKDAWLKGLEPMDLFEEVEDDEVELDVSDKSLVSTYHSYTSLVDGDEEPSSSILGEESTSSSLERASVMPTEDAEREVREASINPPLRQMNPERASLEDEYKDAFYEWSVAKDQNYRLQDQLVHMLTKNEKDYNEYTTEGETLQEKELYVKLFGRYVTLIKHYGEMEDLGKEELIKQIKLKKEVDELLNNHVEKKWNSLVGKNRNEKSSKVQLANKLEETERKKWAEANDLHLANLAIKIQMEKLSELLQQQEVIGGNFTIMGYNQLKHDNLMAREIIAQKNEQCESVLRNTKISAQKLTHVKEKLNFIRQQYKTKVDTLYSKEKLCDQIYSELKEAKRARTKARQLLSSLQSKNDLLSYPELLMDYEWGIEKTLRLRQQMGRLSHEYNTTSDHFKTITKKLHMD